MLDLSKLQANDAALVQALQDLKQKTTDEHAKIQSALDALAGISTDPVVQAAIDAEAAKIAGAVQTVADESAAVDALPTSPTPPAA